MKRIILSLISLFAAASGLLYAQYQPTPEILEARREFSEERFGIFLHWGIYSMFGQGEWYLNSGLDRNEYAKAAAGFYPANFDAAEWVSAIKASGAKYITITSRHHDGFSMWHSAQSPYNIVDATPFGRDVLKELSEECRKQGIKLHFYYSHLDWMREDYPQGRTGHNTGRDASKADWNSYYNFMNAQLRELLTGYGPVGAIWFDGWWDHDEDATPFDWELERQYAMIHELQPSCLVGNNHHQTPFPGEDIQIFERDLPGENKAGLSGQDISPLPLETCETMNGMWGYKVADQNYKSVDTIIRYIVSAAGRGANLLLNIGPQPDGSLPATAVDRLRQVGEWMAANGDSIYGTVKGDIDVRPWGVTTRRQDKLFVHIMELQDKELYLPLECKVKSASYFGSGMPVKFTKLRDGGVLLRFDELPSGVDTIVELVTEVK